MRNNSSYQFRKKACNSLKECYTVNVKKTEKAKPMKIGDAKPRV